MPEKQEPGNALIKVANYKSKNSYNETIKNQRKQLHKTAKNAKIYGLKYALDPAA